MATRSQQHRRPRPVSPGRSTDGSPAETQAMAQSHFLMSNDIARRKDSKLYMSLSFTETGLKQESTWASRISLGVSPPGRRTDCPRGAVLDGPEKKLLSSDAAAANEVEDGKAFVHRRRSPRRPGRLTKF